MFEEILFVKKMLQNHLLDIHNQHNNAPTAIH